MSVSWKPGKRIQKLPKWIQPLAILFRNIIILTKLRRTKYTDSEIEVHKKLSFGVEYVCGTDVEGDIAEFGTMTGRTARIIAQAMSKFDYWVFPYQKGPKKLHLFDSFEGLPKAESDVDKESPHVKSGVWGEGTCKGISKEKLMRICAKFWPKERIIIYDGWFKDTLSQIPHGTKFSMLHIDCDMYQSTIEVLNYCFSNGLVQDGTVIFFDDWNANKASPNFGERRAWLEIVEKFSVAYSDCGEYGWAGRKFIVHSYKSAIP